MAKTEEQKGQAPPPPAPARMSLERVNDKVHVWPYLTRLEFQCAIIVMLILSVWSIVVDAPLERPANTALTPNPSKAPWYFLGLQEMLVYFDPWIAGVVLPSLIIVGLMLIPYLDVNPKGSGYYCFRDRRYAILVFIFGFAVLWIALIINGVFLRGPGWNFFAPWEPWDPHRVVAITNVDLPYAVGIRSERGAFLFGGAVIFLYYLSAVPWYLWRRPRYRNVGVVRYALKAFLFLTMMALPIKMFLRIAFNIKYIWVTPWFNI
ncbi:MAG: cytochrome C [Nitrospinota bacterium]